MIINRTIEFKSRRAEKRLKLRLQKQAIFANIYECKNCSKEQQFCIVCHEFLFEPKNFIKNDFLNVYLEFKIYNEIEDYKKLLELLKNKNDKIYINLRTAIILKIRKIFDELWISQKILILKEHYNRILNCYLETIETQNLYFLKILIDQIENVQNEIDKAELKLKDQKIKF
ncbi:hypothetical protein GVAV_003176 [Gurleya vavrai]